MQPTNYDEFRLASEYNEANYAHTQGTTWKKRCCIVKAKTQPETIQAMS